MFRRILALASLSLILGCSAFSAQAQENKQPGAENAPAASKDTLPVRRVVLYKHGVGYFMRLGKVDGNARVLMNFKKDQMNDLLKSLTVLDLTGGTVQSIGYESTKTVAQQLEEYTFNLQDANSLPAILNQMKGAEVMLQVASGPVAGRILSIEKHSTRKDNTVVDENRLSILCDDGVVKSYELPEITQIQFKDPKLQSDMQKYLTTLFSRNHRDEKQVVIATAGKGARDLFASYIQEQPVWKVSYRIVMDDKKEKQPLLQGWAIVDNVSAEDWKDVSLSLVSGLPVSFVQEMYEPWYVKRPTLALQAEGAVGPVRYAPGEMLQKADRAEMQAKDGVGRKAAFGAAAGAAPAAEMRAMNGLAAPPTAATMQAMEQQVTAAAAQAMGALFSYDIKEPVSVDKDHSAMIPIVSSRIDARRVSIYDQAVRRDNPMEGLLLKNTTGLTLEGGPVTVYEKDTYAGEALIETFQPAGKAEKTDKADKDQLEKKDVRLISYAVDLGTRVNPVAGGGSQNIFRLRVVNGTIYLDYRQQQVTTYNLNNVEDKDKTIIIQHPFMQNWELVNTPKPMEQTAQYYRFEVPLAANKQVAFPVTQEMPGTTAIGIINAQPDQLLFYASQKYVDAKTKDFLEKAAKLQGEINDMTRQSQELERQKQEITQSQNRVRQNMQALGNTDQERTLRARYVKDLEAQENQYQDAAKKQDDLAAQIAAKKKELNDLVAGYKFEGK